MIDVKTHKRIVRQLFTNRRTVDALDKLHNGKDVGDNEFSALYSESRHVGIAYFSLYGERYVAAFSKSRMKADKTGRLMPIICDFCRTRLPGSKAARISFEHQEDNHTVAWLVCDDLACSLNARELTVASLESQKMMRESVSIDRKIDRLRQQLIFIIGALGLKPLEDEK